MMNINSKGHTQNILKILTIWSRNVFLKNYEIALHIFVSNEIYIHIYTHMYNMIPLIL